MRRLLAASFVALVLGGAISAAGPSVEAGPASPAARAALDRADSLISGGFYAEADSFLKREGATLDAAFEDDTQESLDLLSLRGEVAWRLGRTAEADSLLRRNVERNRQRHGADSVERARALRVLASYLSGTKGGCEAAYELVDEAVALFEKAGGPNHPQIPLALSTSAICHARAGEYAQALPIFEKVAESTIAAHGERDLRAADAMQNLGSIHYVLTDYEAARENYARALTIYREELDPRSSRLVGMLANLGNVQSTVGDFAAALQSYDEALRIAVAGGSDRTRITLTLRLGLADVHAQLGDLDEADRHLDTALEIAQSLDENSLAEVPSILSQQGDVAVARGDLDRGIALLREALKMREEEQGPEHDFTANILFDLARSLRRAGQLDEARAISERLLDLRLRQRGAGSNRVAEARRGLARVEMERGQWAEARRELEAALEALDPSMERSGLHLSLCLDLARAREATGDLPGAVDMLEGAADLQRESVRATATALSETQALRYQAAGRRAVGALVELCTRPELPTRERERAWSRVASARGLVLDEMTRRLRLVRAHPEPHVRTLFAQLADVDERLSNLYLRPAASNAGPRREAALRSLASRKESLEKALALEIGSERALEPAAPVAMEDLRAAASEGTMLLSYVNFGPVEEPKLGAFFLAGPRARVRFVDLGAMSPIDSLVSAWLAEARVSTTHPSIATRSEETARELGTEIRRRVLDPVFDAGAIAGRVRVVPVGSLHLVPWMALPDEHGGYLAESKLLFESLNTERELLREPADPGEGMLALGDPDFDSADDEPGNSRSLRRPCVEIELQGFAALPGARREVENLAREWNRLREVGRVQGEAVAELGQRASETVLRDESRGRRVVHVATHGFFLASPCEAMAEASTRGAALPTPAHSEIAASNPLLLSGLALAGADAPNHTARNDGIFTAAEMSTLDLDGVEWFVLSGCDTGQGTVGSSEGVFGMRRALNVAGARTVIMSLWPVDDTTARLWMEELYRARFDLEQSTPEAVRTASLRLLEQRRRRGLPTPPSTWTPFQASGR